MTDYPAECKQRIVVLLDGALAEYVSAKARLVSAEAALVVKRDTFLTLVEEFKNSILGVDLPRNRKERRAMKKRPVT